MDKLRAEAAMSFEVKVPEKAIATSQCPMLSSDTTH